MFIYDTKLPFEVRITRPDMKYYLLLDRQLKGCSSGLKQAAVYIRQSFMINNPTFHDIFMRLGARQISDMEVLSCIIHQMHGEDDRYYDESNDDTPVFEFIKPCHTQEEHCSCQPESEEEQHHVNNDLTAAVMRDMQYEEEQIHIYEELIRYIQDDGADEAFSYLLDSAKKAMDTLRNLLHILTTHTEMKDFGEGDTHNAWDLDTSNYFDKPNPTFVNPSDIEDFPFKR